jgi:hypothetical protein
VRGMRSRSARCGLPLLLARMQGEKMKDIGNHIYVGCIWCARTHKLVARKNVGHKQTVAATPVCVCVLCCVLYHCTTQNGVTVALDTRQEVVLSRFVDYTLASFKSTIANMTWQFVIFHFNGGNSF